MGVANTYTIASVACVAAYFAVAWLAVGRDPKCGVIMTQYSPPRNLSPAMLRYIWKEGLDERVFWAGVLDLVSKGVVSLESESPVAVIQRRPGGAPLDSLPEEEAVLERALVGERKKIALNALDSATTEAVSKMYATIRRVAGEAWFCDNEEYLRMGGLLSLVALCVALWPQSEADWFLLLLCIALMTPSAVNLRSLVPRFADLYRASQHAVSSEIVWRATGLISWIVACCAGLALGLIILGVNSGMRFVAAAGLLAAINIVAHRYMKAPTIEGRKLMDEIEGFRDFLENVDRLPMDRWDAPSSRIGIYEKYLPYAVALEVEQAWSDKFFALVATTSASDIIGDRVMGERTAVPLATRKGKILHIVPAPWDED